MKKQKHDHRTLALSQETVRTLETPVRLVQHDELKAVVGGRSCACHGNH